MKLLQHRAGGILLHPTSLPGPHGSGDFGPSARHFVDWLAGCGQGVWQWLPVTPVGPGYSPYQGLSAFAGNPLLVALEPLVEAGWLPPPERPERGFDPQWVDYARVAPWRMAQLRRAADGFAAAATDGQRTDFAAWRESQRDWLDDYALFMVLHAAHGDRPWWTWSAPLRRREPAALDEARRRHRDDAGFWLFVQWCFDRQCAALRDYAASRGVRVLGDLPIFVAHDSADCWVRPDLFELDDDDQPTVVAGVPPDELGPRGQRWGNPLYRWGRMAAEDWAWWTARMRRTLQHADAFRIDHFRGFARTFEIPASCPDATLGRWRPGPGQDLFDRVGAVLGPLPIVAEDLGFITPDVPALRHALGYPGMKVLQFAFGDDAGHDYLPHNYDGDTVVYSGTHDCDTALGWWLASDERTRRFAGSYLACGAHDVHWAMIRALFNSVARLAIVPMQDVLGLDSRFRLNVPGTMGGLNWAWRFDWPQVGEEPGRVLGLITAGSGRGDFALLGIGVPAKKPPASY